MKPNGNGEYTLTKRAVVVAALILTIIGMIAGMAVAWGSATQAFNDHAANGNIHWAQAALDEQYMPRREIEVHLGAIHEKLDRISHKTDLIRE